MYNIRRTAERVSRGSSRRIDSAPSVVPAEQSGAYLRAVCAESIVGCLLAGVGVDGVPGVGAVTSRDGDVTLAGMDDAFTAGVAIVGSEAEAAVLGYGVL
jgi:hypothetical protein